MPRQSRRLRLVAAVSVAGSGMVAAGWLLQGPEYVPAFLLQIGSTLVLLAPISVLERRLLRAERNTERINDTLTGVDRQVRSTAAQIESLSGQRPTLQELDGGRQALLADAEQRPSRTTVLRALREAARLGAVSQKGVRVAPAHPLTGVRLRLLLRTASSADDGDALLVRVESAEGGRVSPWHPWPPEDEEGWPRPLLRVLEEETAEAAGGGPVEPPPLTDVVALLRVAVDARTGRRRDLGAVVERPTADWVVSDEGLYGLNRPDRVPRQAVRDHAGRGGEGRGREGVPLHADPAGFAAAVAAADAAYRAEALEA